MSASKPRGNRFFRVICLSLAVLLSGTVLAQEDSVEIKTSPLTDNLFMLQGKGGNIGLFVGADGAFLVDDDYAPLTPKIKAAVAEQTDKPVRFVFNTHWHSDHTGGNENFGEAGAVIVAHDNVRERLSSEQFIEAFGSKVAPTPDAGLPVITFNDEISFHFNGDEVAVRHVAPAHTDGDAWLHFKAADVIHTGDVFFNGFYPFIDASSGGRMDGMIAAAEEILAMAGPDTKIIPGHGPLAAKADLRAYRDMLVAVRDQVAALIEAGKTRQEVIAAKPTADFDAEWGGGFLPPDKWVGIVYDAMQ